MLKRIYLINEHGQRISIVPRRGLGDVVAAVATPIARLIHLDCIDPETKQLKPKSGCAKRRAMLNKKFPIGQSS